MNSMNSSLTKLEKYTPFTTSIWKYKLDIDNETHKNIVNYVYDLKEKGQSRHISNHGGWQSNCLNEIQDPSLKILFDKLSSVTEEILFDLELHNYILSLESFWFNINGKNHYNIAHIHTGSSLSGVFYLKMPKRGGQIQFDRGDNQMWALPLETDFTKRGTAERCSSISIEPQELEYVVFPSSLQHSVQPNLSDEDRISMAINCNLRCE